MAEENHAEKSLQPETPLDGFINQKEGEALEKFGILNVGELLDHFPKRYEDRTRFDAFPSQAGGPPVCIRGIVLDSSKRGFGGTKSFCEVVVVAQGDGIFMGGKITCRWFNMPYIHKVLAAGHEVILFGKVKDSAGKLVIDHPEFEIVEEGMDVSLHLERIVPVYKLKSGLNQRRMRELVHYCLNKVDPKSLVAAYDLDPTYPRGEAYMEMHFPHSTASQQAAYRFFALEEFFKIQLNVAWRRHHYRTNKGNVMGMKKSLLTAFYENLPFDFTNAQKRSVKEIIADMMQPIPMNRMLQGDVGSGKTFVALCAALLAVESGFQVALMAPTQILAEQHFIGFKKWLDPLGVKVGLCMGNRKEDLENAQIIIGTHALIFEEDAFVNLGLVVVDEQHKFGVKQRSALIQKGVVPDVLVMTATPIPRTLTLTLYGDLDVSILDERPKGRGAMVTGLRVKPKVSSVTKFIKEQLEKGRQAYIVYPLVEESESLAAASAVAEFAKWQKRFSKHEVGLLHGKLKSEEKESVMGAFRDGKIDVLVSTTVIEVGVDVPNANIMLIYNAERFGLAQLHQLRGRIGRGEHKSYCILVTDGKSTSGIEKLEILVGTHDGFKIAEADLALRGPGDVLGTYQSGLSDLRFVDALADIRLIREARSIADSLIQSDPELKNHPRLLSQLDLTEAPE